MNNKIIIINNIYTKSTLIGFIISAIVLSNAFPGSVL